MIFASCHLVPLTAHSLSREQQPHDAAAGTVFPTMAYLAEFG
jgi:hypothetical protein